LKCNAQVLSSLRRLISVKIKYNKHLLLVTGGTFENMSLQLQLQANIILLKGSATKAKDIQDINIIAARIMVKLPGSGLDS
jgi:hypothetical protein